MKIWQKKSEELDRLFERFTIGKDPELDLELAKYDVRASIAHVKMLGGIGLLTEKEKKLLAKELEVIGQQITNGLFEIEPGMEDCHSQIEWLLTQKLGDTGKKVHSGRSRNDQVLVAMKLYAKEQLEVIAHKTKQFFELLLTKRKASKNDLMPGYTHMQVAMPSSFGLWFGAHAEALVDDLLMIKTVHQQVDKNPLGSAAGYGSSFPLNREQTTETLDFTSMNYNAVYAQMTRGKMEKAVSFALSSLASSLGKFANDVCLYSGQDFDFFQVEKKFTTGSSIMPHKHNPDGFELVRAKCNQLQALPYELNMVLANLPTGYHRDLQVLKERFIPAIKTIIDCLDVLYAMTKNLGINQQLLDQEKYDLLFTVEKVNEFVLEGMPFRDAYKRVGEQVLNGTYQPDKVLKHTHTGSIGNLANAQIKHAFEQVWVYFERSLDELPVC